MGAGQRAMVIAGFVLHGLLLPVFVTSGLVVPWPVAGALIVLWVCVAAAVVHWRRRPGLVLAAPFLALAVLVAVVTLGEWLFDWTA